MRLPGVGDADYYETLGWDEIGSPPAPFDETGDTGWAVGDVGDTGWFGSSIVNAVTSPVRHAVSYASKLAKKAGGLAASTVGRIAKAGLPAVGQLLHAPELLTRTISAAGNTALHAIKLADPRKYAGLVQHGLSELTQNPLFNIAQTGVSFIPGVGTAVSGGMAAAAAVGRGESLNDIALDAAKGALPGGPLAQAAFDIAVGVAKGGNLSDAATHALREQVPGGEIGKAAFDAGMAVARKGSVDPDMLQVVRQGLPDASRGVFDSAVGAASNAMADQMETQGLVTQMPGVAGRTRQLAAELFRNPDLHDMTVRRLSDERQMPIRDVQDAVAALLHHHRPTMGVRWHDVGYLDSTAGTAARLGIPIRRVARSAPRVFRVPQMNVSRELLLRLRAHGSTHAKRVIDKFAFLPKVARITGELTGPTTWTVRSGDSAVTVAQKLTGRVKEPDGSWTWKQLGTVNPNMTVSGAEPSPWGVGQAVNIPPAWVGAVAPPATPPGGSPPGGSPPAWTPPQQLPPTTAGGPPFPPPSKYPNGFPGATYTAKKGEFGSTIAQDITGNAGRWKELLAVNPSTASAAYGMAFQPGDVLQLPLSWQGKQPQVIPALPPVTPPAGNKWTPTTPGQLPPGTTTPPIFGPPAQTPPSGGPPSTTPPAWIVTGTQQQIAVIEAMLTTWLAKHLSENTVTPPFGGDPQDLNGVWTQRAQLTTKAFQLWWDKMNPNAQVRNDGFPDDATVAALRKQVESELPPLTTPPQPGFVVPTGPPVASDYPPAKKSDGGGLAALGLIAASLLLG